MGPRRRKVATSPESRGFLRGADWIAALVIPGRASWREPGMTMVASARQGNSGLARAGWQGLKRFFAPLNHRPLVTHPKPKRQELAEVGDISGSFGKALAEYPLVAGAAVAVVFQP